MERQPGFDLHRRGRRSGVPLVHGDVARRQPVPLGWALLRQRPQNPGSWQLPLTNGTTNVIPPPEIATNMHVNFNFQVDASGNPRPEQQFAILQLTEHRLGGFDFAIIRLAGNPGHVRIVDRGRRWTLQRTTWLASSVTPPGSGNG